MEFVPLCPQDLLLLLGPEACSVGRCSTGGLAKVSYPLLLNDTLDLLLALADIRIDELTFSSGLCVSGHGNCFGIPISSIAVRCDICDVVLGEIVSQVLHGLLVVRHEDIDVEPVFRQLLVDGHCQAAAEAAGDRNCNHGHITVGSNDLLCDAISDIVGNSQGRTGQDASPVLDQNGLGSAECVI